jgi:hypothetical protein
MCINSVVRNAVSSCKVVHDIGFHTDHDPIVAQLKSVLPKNSRRREFAKRIDVLTEDKVLQMSEVLKHSTKLSAVTNAWKQIASGNEPCANVREIHCYNQRIDELVLLRARLPESSIEGRKLLTRMIQESEKKAARDHTNSVCKEMSSAMRMGDDGHLWKIMREITGPPRNRKNLPKAVNKDGLVVEEICEVHNICLLFCGP